MSLKIIKKNQLAILVISLMLITAGYLSYGTNYNNNLNVGVSATEVGENADVNLAALGDAELVNTNVSDQNNDQNKEKISEENNQEENANINVNPVEENKENNNTNNSKIDNGNYFTTSKLERNVMYSQMISRYKEIIESNAQVTEQKAIAQEEINKINKLQNAIMITENLLNVKGFEQNIIFVNGDSISVIIGKSELGTDEIAQIQNIVSRELSADISNIHISTK